MILAKAVAFGEALKPEFKEYQEQVVKNAKALARQLKERNIKLVSDGTDNHLVLLDLRPYDITGLELEQRLAKVGIITNKNGIPFDTKNKATTSGLRIGTPAVTARGLIEEDMKMIADIIAALIVVSDDSLNVAIEKGQQIVEILTKKYPLSKALREEE